MTEPWQTIRFAVDDDDVATLTLKRPEVMNAWNGRMAFGESSAPARDAPAPEPRARLEAPAEA